MEQTKMNEISIAFRNQSIHLIPENLSDMDS